MLSLDKCKKGRLTKHWDTIVDNGRVLKLTGATILYLTELDIEILNNQYDFEQFEFLKVYTSERGQMPKWFIDLTDMYFTGKNTLKEIDIVEYGKAKSKLNAIYGCSASALVRDKIIMDVTTGEWSSEVEDVEAGLKKYYNSRNNFMRYQFGCWITSHCRYRLAKMIEFIGYDNFLYADTDSIFYKSNDEIEAKLEKLNEENRKHCLEIGAGIYDINNNFVEYMTFEDEKDNIEEFKFLHAKCYGFVDKDKKLHITVAGVTRNYRNDRTKTREDELGSLENLKDGFTFKECGGTTASYIHQEARVETVEGHQTELASGVIISEVEYTIKDINTCMLTENIFVELKQ